MNRKLLLIFAIVGLIFSLGASQVMAQASTTSSTSSDTTTTTTKKAKKAKSDTDQSATTTADTTKKTSKKTKDATDTTGTAASDTTKKTTKKATADTTKAAEQPTRQRSNRVNRGNRNQEDQQVGERSCDPGDDSGCCGYEHHAGGEARSRARTGGKVSPCTSSQHASSGCDNHKRGSKTRCHEGCYNYDGLGGTASPERYGVGQYR